MNIINKSQLFQRYVWLLIFIFGACEYPVGLYPVSGVEGDVIVGDSLLNAIGVKGISLVALDKLDQTNPQDHLIAYSDPILYDTLTSFPQDTIIHFFIQLQPPGCVLVPVGLTIDPEIFFVNLESFLNDSTWLPIVFPEISDPMDIVNKTKTVPIEKNKIFFLDEPWEIQF